MLRRIVSLALMFVVLGLSPPAGAQFELMLDSKGIEEALDAINAEFEALKESIEAADPEELSITAMRDELNDIDRRLGALMQAIIPLKETKQASLGALGPAPAEGEDPEPDDIAAERKDLEERLARLAGLERRVNVLDAQILLLDKRLAALSRARFLDHILERGPWPLSPAVWQGAANGFREGLVQTVDAAKTWFSVQEQAGRPNLALATLIGGVLFVVVLAWPVRLMISAHLSRLLGGHSDEPAWLFGIALARFFNRAGAITVGLLVLFAVAEFQNLVTVETRPIADSLVLAVFVTFIGHGLAKAVFAPKTPHLRPLSLTDGQARGLSWALTACLILVSADLVVRKGADALEAGLDLAVAQSFILSVAVALVVLPLSYRGLWQAPERAKGEENPPAPQWHERLRLSILVFAAVIVAAALLGYAALARYMVEKGVYLAALLLLFYLLRGFCQSLAQRVIDQSQEWRRRQGAGEEAEKAESFLGFWVGLAIDTVLAVILIPLALLVLGAAWADIRALALQALEGVKIGPVTISFSDFLSAIVLFAIGLVLTRFIQQTLEKRIFPKTHLNFGARNSLKTLVGYFGFLLAFLLAVSAAGFDLSNLAIIAGALSVGIGFGLQSIVNNFVSGLILLFERPIKVGDWIVTSVGEGIVKRISVRATEIETFERQSIIIPNAEIISSSVSNWSHRDKLARLTIAVGVSYSADVRKVERVLLECASENDNIVTWPKPFVYFADFGSSSLDFELRAYVRDNDNALGTRSALRFAIIEKFREADIEIPFPQQDLHVKEWPRTLSAPPSSAPPEPVSRDAPPSSQQ